MNRFLSRCKEITDSVLVVGRWSNKTTFRDTLAPWRQTQGQWSDRAGDAGLAQPVLTRHSVNAGVTSWDSEAVVQHKLVAAPCCVNFVITRKVHSSIDQVELRKRHDVVCGGDPQLFDVMVDRANGHMAKGAADPADGLMEMHQ